MVIPTVGWVMFGVDPDIGGSAIWLWVAAGSAALLVFICATAFDWTQMKSVRRIGVMVLTAVLGGALAWVFLDAASVRDQRAEWRALETRAATLDAQSLAPGSPLACLNGLIGEQIEAACEKALFATPATVAAAATYSAARIALLADMVVYAQHSGANIDSVVVPLRRALEVDQFGFVAHMLAARDGCTSENCQALALLHDPNQVRANLSGHTLDRYLDHYLTVWAQSPQAPPADVVASSAAPLGTPSPHKIIDIDFPSAASIPAVSIMNPEPKGPPAAAAAAAVEAGAREASGPSRPARKQAAAPLPPPPAPSAPVDPVWLPGTATSSAAARAAGAGSAPVQLAPPQASSGGAARGQ